MEKLQVAIEKAREQRESGQQGPKPRGKAGSKAPTPAIDVWQSAATADIKPRVARKNRLTSFNGGREAGPYDMLRSRILQQAESNGWKRIALVSSHSGCGKTTTAANLAFSFGRQQDLKTMLFDLDLRRAGLAKMLGLTCAHNMGDVLKGEIAFSDHAIRYGSNVMLGLNDGPIKNSSELLQSQRTLEVLNEIDDTYKPDIMLFDMPPLMASDDNFGFLKNVDCAILLVEAEKTTVDEIDVAERQLAELTNVMGVVLNKSRYTDGAYGYGYGYD
ncbi:CpsD/CapB family tyrosine-protein kinase [Pseudohalocynthiibacter sp. F2068]|uniref:CpsD/CapB family tyrosine-protein kinase n=1 Tax=Pseudohalocynthiibacter sp. F2068 TaxID=2926418 RepID=UPI001FF2EA05|nr:CpsD/CapB family tyrosine-protein kinase [Pseudohalocynthiibacter sp. F2068]MCK0104638.1 CpsD/CapB family tyrosine-protein kinase [Pseudohalocynthiibacter sp. F2068]